MMRYSRQMLVPSIGVEGQQLIQQSSILVVGAGGIGSSVLLYLAGSGVGTVEVVDFDVVEESNLHRQIIHSETTIGIPKCESAALSMLKLNSNVKVVTHNAKMTASNAIELVSRVDLVIDASDNFEARYTINDACVLTGVPLVSGSAVGMEGQVTVLNVGTSSPCYRCLHPALSVAEACRSCANAGVLGTVPGLIGCLQVTEAIKVLLAYEAVSSDTPLGEIGEMGEKKKRYARRTSASSKAIQPLINKQLFYDGYSGEFFTFQLNGRNIDCRICGNHPSIVSMLDSAEDLRRSMELAVCATTPESILMSSLNARISVADYYQLLSEEREHILLDVRSTVQFNMVSLLYYHDRDKFNHVTCSSSAALDSSNSQSTVSTATKAAVVSEQFKKVLNSNKIHILNIPMKELSLVRQNNSSAIAQLLTPIAAATAPIIATEPSACPLLPIYILCRRGVDSIRATEKLLQLGLTNVYNIEGGLTAWRNEIDDSFPNY